MHHIDKRLVPQPGILSRLTVRLFRHIPRRIACDVTLALNVAVVILATLGIREAAIVLAIVPDCCDAFFVQFSVLFATIVFATRLEYNLANARRGGVHLATAAVAAGLTAFCLNGIAGRVAVHSDDTVVSIATLVVAAGLALITRLALVRVFTRSDVFRETRRRVAVYGATDESRAAFRSIAQNNQRMRLVGLFDDRKSKKRHQDVGVQVSGDLRALLEVVRDGDVDEVIVALAQASGDRIRNIIRELESFPVDVYVPLDTAAETVEGNFTASSFGTVRIAHAKKTPVRDWGAVGKWLVDRLGGWTALVLGAPVFALIAVAIKLDSRGPVFFRQKRHGLCGQSIIVWKFRTMRVMEDGDSVQQARKRDPRITRVGAILRRTSLDEIPQFINVAMGEMSIVGPRPHAVAHNQYYADFIEAYNGRNQMKPGITGWAQINGFRGETEDPSLMEKRVNHDLWYIRNWSIWLDLKIIFLTPVFGLVHKNAY